MINLCRVCVLRRRAVTAPNQAMLDEQPLSLPVDDAFAVEEEEADRYLCCIKPEAREKEGGGGHTTGCFIFQKIGQGFQQSEGMELKKVMKGRVTK